ncbi:MAG: hypothetical protein RI897_2169 [Verrucomicrobiota bacterium]
MGDPEVFPGGEVTRFLFSQGLEMFGGIGVAFQFQLDEAEVVEGGGVIGVGVDGGLEEIAGGIEVFIAHAYYSEVVQGFNVGRS